MDSDGNFFYANALEMAVSQFDFSFRFLRQGAAPPKLSVAPGSAQQTGILRLDAMVVGMSPSHAKAMVGAIFKAVREYEKTYGKIPVEKAVEDDYQATFAPLLK